MTPQITVTVNYEIGDDRPTGDNFVRYEDLHVTGDTFQKAIERVPTGKIITFPAETFEINTPGWDIGDRAALWMPQHCGGFWGSGKGSLGRTDQGTVFRVKENSSPNVSVPGAWFKSEDSTVPLTLRNFQVQGTEQGYQVDAKDPANGWNGTDRKLFTNLFIYNPKQYVYAADILSTGWHGNSGGPPGETFGFLLYGAPDFLVERVECDGRREPGGPAYGAAGLTIGNAVKGDVREAYCHHVMQAGIAMFQSGPVTTHDCVLGDPAEKDSSPSIYGYTRGCWLNHERCTQNTHYDITLNTWPHVKTTEHVSHSNDSWTLNRWGKSIPVDNGTVTLINPTWSNIVFGRLAVATWVPYSTGNTMTLDNRPKVFKADGSKLPFDWNYGGSWKKNITT